jgi:hypothetical protein
MLYKTATCPDDAHRAFGEYRTKFKSQHISAGQAKNDSGLETAALNYQPLPVRQGSHQWD